MFIKSSESHGIPWGSVTSPAPWIVPGASCIPSQAALNLRCNGPAPRNFGTHPFWMAYPLVMADIAIEHHHY